MATGKALDGKPYAGNPHVRFDEGEVASCTAEASLRRGAFFAITLAALAVCPALARTVTVASCDRTTGATTLAISAAEVGDGDKALFAAWSQSDIVDIADASETAYVGIVAASDTVKSYTIPSEWLGKVGVVSFFLMADIPPYETLLTYIRSESAGPYIDTGFVPDTNSDVRVKTYYPFNVVGTPFGVKGMLTFFNVWDETPDPTTGAYHVSFFGAGGSGQSGSGATVPHSSGPHEYTINATGAYIDGELYQAFNSADFTKSTTYSLTLFGRKLDDGSQVQTKGNCTIYWAQLRQNGVLEHDYVPCRKNGGATMYDRVNQSFCAVSGSGSFTEGEALDPDAQDCGGVESSDVVVVIPGATWDGGGADTSFATAANWEGDELPNLSDGLTTLTFATGGSEAQVPASGASAFGITFDTANNFALTAASGGTLALGAGGITLANRAVPSGTTWRYHDLNLPVMLVADQTWDLSTVSKQRLRLLADGNLQGTSARTLTITGNGSFALYATNDFAGTVVLNGGVINTFSKVRPFGSAAGGGEIVIDQSKGASLNMFSSVIDKPIRITSSSSGNELKFTARGTSSITAPIYQSSANPFIIDLNYNSTYGYSTLTLSGGGTFSGPVWLYPGNTELRTLVIEGAPIVHSAPGDTDKAFKFYGKGELHLKNQGNRMCIVLGVDQHCTGNSLHCWTNNVLSTDCDVSLSYSGRMDIHGFDQQFGDLTTGSGGRIRSDEPAEIYAYYDIDGGKTWGVNAGLDGAVTFRKGGRQPLTINGTNTTTGALIAQNGPLVIGETGFWQSADVCIGATNSNRHAILQLKRSNSFADPRHTMLTMTASTASTFYTDCGESREPELKLDAGVNAVFKRVILNGRCLAPGTWGGSESSAEHKDATHFSGSGMITVLTGGGFFLIVR